MAAVEAGKGRPAAGRQHLRQAAGLHRQQVGPHGLPARRHGLVVLLQAMHQALQRGVAAGLQGREEVALLVLVVGRAGQVEVAHHVGGRLLRIGVGTALRQVLGQALQQHQHALHPLMAGQQHLEGFVEAGGRGRMQDQGRGHGQPCNSPSGWCARATVAMKA